jgi:hypothetical protein
MDVEGRCTHYEEGRIRKRRITESREIREGEICCRNLNFCSINIVYCNGHRNVAHYLLKLK